MTEETDKKLANIWEIAFGGAFLALVGTGIGLGTSVTSGHEVWAAKGFFIAAAIEIFVVIAWWLSRMARSLVQTGIALGAAIATVVILFGVFYWVDYRLELFVKGQPQVQPQATATNLSPAAVADGGAIAIAEPPLENGITEEPQKPASKAPRKKRSTTASREEGSSPVTPSGGIYQNMENSPGGFQHNGPLTIQGPSVTDASPTAPPTWKLTIQKPAPDVSNGAKLIILVIESNRRLVPWRAAVKLSEKTLLVSGSHGTAGFIQQMVMSRRPIVADVPNTPVGDIHVVGSDDAIVPGEAIYLYLRELPSSLWVGNGNGLWLVDLSVIR